MHAPLGNPNRQLACAELIEALEVCHAQGMIARLTGACNPQKAALAVCLRKERKDREARNHESAKQRTIKKKQVWEELEREKEKEGL
ncbi:hypothetical protein I302_107658 [Kwoniella bestiolae CBS 10118]|uniref:COX assembly mitochondrial protein n=1 Tax=Kwoniella bestiolae CBS 10118 TaxID=1296100 RepID=A0A1B9FXZ3_9TREE|nr:hypothetical protein I302_06603 [Kwoniella bestiolae CBS 10118]OCF23620.1 hypothetical protein I302_06603 [Kwoniella bestiolae CBS 10118]